MLEDDGGVANAESAVNPSPLPGVASTKSSKIPLVVALEEIAAAGEVTGTQG